IGETGDFLSECFARTFCRKSYLKTAPECWSWQQGEEFRAFVLNFSLSVLKSVQMISDQI
ncbi:hypothetical protein, partial [Microcystis aeruginosa]|uniref:hypothetical protein n=1 Tax=Microcystis aeruginosa TaxID=1126 RepID=UPI001F2113E5